MSALIVAVLLATGSTQGAVLEQVAPEYPAWAIGTGLSTTVALKVRVTSKGLPSAIHVEPYSTRHDVLRRSLRASFDSAAVRAVRQWRFRPATHDGRPVAGWIRLEVPLEEAWTNSADPHAVPPDSIRSSAHWNALMGEWLRVPPHHAPVGHPSALRFRRGGWYLRLDAAGAETPGRFELSSNGSLDDPAAMLALTPESGDTRWRYLMRFAGRDTLVLCPWRTTGACDTFIAVARETPR